MDFTKISDSVIGFFIWALSQIPTAIFWSVDFFGGGVRGWLATASILGLIIYLPADLIYHKFIDKTIAVAGMKFSGGARYIVLAIFVLLFVFAVLI